MSASIASSSQTASGETACAISLSPQIMKKRGREGDFLPSWVMVRDRCRRKAVEMSGTSKIFKILEKAFDTSGGRFYNAAHRTGRPTLLATAGLAHWFGVLGFERFF